LLPKDANPIVVSRRQDKVKKLFCHLGMAKDFHPDLDELLHYGLNIIETKSIRPEFSHISFYICMK